MVLRTFGLGKELVEERIRDEITYLLQSFEEKKTTGVPFDPFCFLDSAVTNIISTLLLGKRFGYDDNSLRNVLDLVHQNVKSGVGFWAQLYNAVPLVRGLPLPHRTIFREADKVKAFFSKELEEHKATFVPEEHRDYLDAYLEEIQKNRINIEPTIKDQCHHPRAGDYSVGTPFSVNQTNVIGP